MIQEPSPNLEINGLRIMKFSDFRIFRGAAGNLGPEARLRDTNFQRDLRRSATARAKTLSHCSKTGQAPILLQSKIPLSETHPNHSAERWLAHR